MERDLKMTRLSALSSPDLAKFVKYNKWNISFLRELVIIFSPIYLLEAIFVISSFNLMTVLQELIPDAIIII